MHTYIFVVVNFDALAQASDIRIERRQVFFLCWRQDSNPEGLRHLFASRLNTCWQTDWAIEDQAKNLNSTARPYDQQAFSPPDPTAIWHSHLALAIYIFVVVNFDALAQASDIRIERRQVVFLCWRQDSNPEGLRHLFASRLNACWQTDWAIEDHAKNLNSTARPYDQQAFSPPDPTAIWHSHLALAIYIFVVYFDALAQASDIRIERRQVVSDTYSPAEYINSYIHAYIHTHIHTMHACMHTYIHSYIHIHIHTYIFIRGFALAQGTFLLVNFAWICCDGFESQLRNGYLLKCDCLFDCNWHIGMVKWEIKIDILRWRDRGLNYRPLASRAGALSITLHLIQLITMVSQELYLALTPNLRIMRKKSYQGYNRHRDIHEIRPRS